MANANYIVLLMLSCLSYKTLAQKKHLIAKFTAGPINIDARKLEPQWDDVKSGTNFVMYKPDNGRPIPDDKKTIVKILYDDRAIYILAYMYDNEVNKISKQLTKRDQIGVVDRFGVYINGNNDGQQDYRFFVTAVGVQSDCLATEEFEDYSWDAVWKSYVKITDFGWKVEMKIPYAALRFPKDKNQVWGLNFVRELKRGDRDEVYTWNYIDTKQDYKINQNGILKGIQNIKPPLRLFFSPYTSAYYENSEEGSDLTLKAGLDLKLGLSDAFTLDAILVPDFGQTKFDNNILNLQPFEQRFDENRDFFTEGSDMFDAGGLFYSRRIGSAPTLSPKLSTNEIVAAYPSASNLLNAVKVSGRTKDGFGLGALNAITNRSFATIIDTISQGTRKEMLSPFVNYNVLVIDKRFNTNSSVSFVNTNTLRIGNFSDANVSAIIADLSTKDNSYALYSDLKYSTIRNFDFLNENRDGANYRLKNYDGFKTQLAFSRTHGKLRFQAAGRYFSKYYDLDDLGFVNRNNYHVIEPQISYRILNPTKLFNNLEVYQSMRIDKENTTGKIQEYIYQTELQLTTIKNHKLGGILTIHPLNSYDFYEPRSYGKYVFIPRSIEGSLGFYSNEINSFSGKIELAYKKFSEEKRSYYAVNVEFINRFNDKLSSDLGINYSSFENDRGWVAEDDQIIFAQRNRKIIENYLTAKYSMNNVMNFNVSARFYHAFSENNHFFSLNNDGTLATNNTYAINKNRNLTSWNFDFSYSWWFAPGSEISILYRNFALEKSSNVQKKWTKNVGNIFQSDINTIFSIRIKYLIDYNSLKNKKKQ